MFIRPGNPVGSSSGLTLVANILMASPMAPSWPLHSLYGHGITHYNKGPFGASRVSLLQLPPRTRTAARVRAAAADLFPRQVWWLATAFVSALGLALLAFGNLQIWKPVRFILLIAPHVSARHMHRRGRLAQRHELASHFVMTTLFAGAMMWLALGIAMAYMLQRMDARQTATQPVT